LILLPVPPVAERLEAYFSPLFCVCCCYYCDTLIDPVIY
jgi:hypothetical protein